MWYPKKAYRMTDNENLGKIKSELTTHEFVPNIQVDENTFRFDFPKGTRIHDRVRGIWGVDLSEEPPSLVGKALPSLENLNLKLDADQVKDKTILICFWDKQQRPSRNCITQLTEQAEYLKEEGVTVIAVQTSNVDKNTFNEWVKKNNIPFPVGVIQDDEEKTRFNWGVKSLPWLILTDRNHVVTAEGFGLDELDNKIGQTGDGK
jgi:peroxiredoxin